MRPQNRISSQSRVISPGELDLGLVSKTKLAFKQLKPRSKGRIISEKDVERKG